MDNDKDSDGIDDSSEILTIHGARLVSKKKDDNDTYTELWLFSSKADNMRDIKRRLLKRVDIPAHKTTSRDGAQTMDFYIVGDIAMLEMTGVLD